MKPGDKVYVYEGDTSSVTTLRDSGFTDYLTGELEFGGEAIADDAKWTEDDLKEMLTFANKAASIITTRKGALAVMPTPEEIQN